MDSNEEDIYDVESLNESSGDEGEFGLMELESSYMREKSNEVDFPYEVLSVEDIVKQMVDCIQEVSMVVEIPASTIRILLNHFRWDKDKLIERLFDGDQQALFRDAHVINPYQTLPRNASNKTERNVVLETECEICFSLLSPSETTGLECDHKFCKMCWSEYLTNKIMDEGLGQTITCPALGCEILVDDATAMSLVRDPDVKKKYQHLITNSYVECNSLMTWCPSPDCNNAIKAQYVAERPVTCKCGRTLCFSCGENWHDPVECKLLKKWNNKNNDDSGTCRWIATNTKDCPKCKTTIQKNGGCNHMTCKICSFEFCWSCLQFMKSHTGHSSLNSCNRFKREKSNHVTNRLSLARYVHYWERYNNHMNSLKYHHNLYASVQSKRKEMLQKDVPCLELQFLLQAVDILCRCRETLMYTYVFAYYLSENNQSVIFETNQADLEISTEALSGYLERDITLDNLSNIKQAVHDKCGYCDSRRRVLLDHVREGFKQGWWEFSKDE